MKRLLAGFLSVLMLVSVLSSCGQSDENTSSVTSSGDGEEVIVKEPFVLAKTVDNLIEGGDFAGEKSSVRCMEESKVVSGSSHGTGDNKCARITGTAYAIAKKSGVPGGKYVLRFWLKDNGATDDVKVNFYVDAQLQASFSGNGTNRWTEYMSTVVTLGDNSTYSVRLDVNADKKTGVCVEWDDISFERIPYDFPDVITGNNPVSQLSKLDNETNAISVGGENLIIKTAFADDLNVSGFKAAGYNTFTYTMSANDPVSKIDDAIAAANKEGLYLQIFYNIKGSDVASEADKTADINAITALMKHLSEKDTQRRVIGINISNAFAKYLYAGKGITHVATVGYMDALAKAVKTSDHAMVVSVSIPGDMPNFIYNTEYIDYNCSELNTADMFVGAQAINLEMSRIGAVAKNTASGDISPMLMSAYSKNGYMAVSKVITNGTVKSIHNKISSIENLLVNTPNKDKASFNTDGIFKNDYVGTKKVGDVYVKFEAYVDNAPVGLAIFKDKTVYCIADKMSFFSAFGVDAVGQSGAFDEKGTFKPDGKNVRQQDAEDGSYRCDYTNVEVMKFTYYLATDPEATSTPLEPDFDVTYMKPRDIEIGVNLLGDGGMEEGKNIFTVKNVRKSGQWIFISDNTTNHAQGKCGINLYCAGGQYNLRGEIDLGVLPAGTYGITGAFFGSLQREGDARVQVEANGKPYKCLWFEGNGTGWGVYIDTFTLTSKAKVKFCVVVECDPDGGGGMWGFTDAFECVRIA